jgi:mercuric ion transport protein
MTIKDGIDVVSSRRGQVLVATGSLLGALAATSCCILPLVLFGLGVSGAWIGNFTQLAPYQPCFIIGTLACLATGYCLVYRSSTVACTDGTACAHPLPSWLVVAGLIAATVLVIAALAFDFVVPLFLNT